MSTQKTETPDTFVRAVEKYLAIEFKYDMAGTELNKKAPVVFTEQEDSLSIDWPTDGWCWLNPPFANVGEWAKKCREQSIRGSGIVSIWPLSGDLNMIPAWEHAAVHVIHGRIWPLVRGCMLCMWDDIDYGVEGLRWDRKELTEIW